jgi:isochorismate synthase
MMDHALDSTSSHGLPLVVGGFAFDAQGRHDIWSRWGDSWFWVPEILVHRGPEGCHAVICGEANGASLGVLQQRLAEIVKQLQAQPVSWTSPPSPGNFVGGAPDLLAWETWSGSVRSALKSLEAGELEKVVLARSEFYRAGENACFDPVATAFALRERQEGCTTFLIQQPGEAFVGSTPEELVRLTGRHLKTVAIAGTRARLDSAPQEHGLQDSDKDQLEQRLVSQAIREALAPVASEVLDPQLPQVASFADVHHLRELVEARLRPGVGVFELICRLHPTPAVGGRPREAALQWLLEHEGLDRGWYAGPVGWVAPNGDSVFSVAIRSALLTKQGALAFAGCGLVPQSEARAEWEEAQVKLQTVQQGLVTTTEGDV